MKVMKANYPGTCYNDERKIVVGDTILFVGFRKSLCEACARKLYPGEFSDSRQPVTAQAPSAPSTGGVAVLERPAAVTAKIDWRAVEMPAMEPIEKPVDLCYARAAQTQAPVAPQRADARKLTATTACYCHLLPAGCGCRCGYCNAPMY